MIILKIILSRAFEFYTMVLVLYALLSWFPNGYNSTLGRFIVRLAEPYLEIFDRYIPSLGGISFNVVIAVFVLQLVYRGIFMILP